MLRIFGWFLLSLMVTGCTSSAPPPSTPEVPVAIEGNGVEKSRPFHLNGGSYQVVWTVRNSGTILASCFGRATIESTAGSRTFSQTITRGSVPVAELGQPKETQLYRVPAGDFIMDVDTNCGPWSVRIAPQ